EHPAYVIQSVSDVRSIERFCGGYYRETAYDQVMEKVDEEGNVLGFSVLRTPPQITSTAVC
ncbi:MAG: hypothetical protein LC674_06550, partial [Actinobacteria bacterium]|nr:hypothetical protein [Actinomycetota bacterium]